MENENLRKVGGPVVHTPYYNACGDVAEDGSVPFEPVKVIDAWGFGEGFCCGNAIKYSLRAQHKGSERLDLEKAVFYLKRVAKRISDGETFAPRQLSQACGAMQVANAWSLPGRLQRALECIEQGFYGEAADEIEKHLIEGRLLGDY